MQDQPRKPPILGRQSWERVAASFLAVQTLADFNIEKMAALAEVIRSLDEREGLKVTPHVYQSGEQEGRWKDDKKFGDGRELVPGDKGAKKPSTSRRTANSPPAPGAPNKSAMLPTRKATTHFDPPTPQRFRAFILSIHIPAQLPLHPESSAMFDTVWYGDGLEIWSGLASQYQVRGFGSVYGHQAEVTFFGVPFGNYFPAQYFLGFTGVLNPVGPEYQEFRGAIAVKADGSSRDLFCHVWDREFNRLPDPNFAPAGYNIVGKIEED